MRATAPKSAAAPSYLPYSTPSEIYLGCFGLFLQAREGSFDFTELSERVEYGNDAFVPSGRRSRVYVAVHASRIVWYVLVVDYIYIYIYTFTSIHSVPSPFVPSGHTGRMSLCREAKPTSQILRDVTPLIADTCKY